MKANNHPRAKGGGGDLRPLVLLTFALLVLILHLCQFPPLADDAPPHRVASVSFAWLHNQPQGEGLYRLPVAMVTGRGKSAPLLPNQVRPLFFQSVSVNRADQQLLSILPGIGPTLAARIVNQRIRQGKFKSPRDLLAVKGIGTGKLKKIRNLLVFD